MFRLTFRELEKKAARATLKKFRRVTKYIQKKLIHLAQWVTGPRRAANNASRNNFVRLAKRTTGPCQASCEELTS